MKDLFVGPVGPAWRRRSLREPCFPLTDPPVRVGGERCKEYAQESAVSESHEELSRQLKRARVVGVSSGRRLPRDVYSHRAAPNEGLDSCEQSARVNSLPVHSQSSSLRQVRWQ